jgi:DNA-directed RNA polymerase subunit RPC12/RpoP
MTTSTSVSNSGSRLFKTPLACARCGSKSVVLSDVVHHLVCAYVGPDYDFDLHLESGRCPKCHRNLLPWRNDWEVVSSSLRCAECGHEAVVDHRAGRIVCEG